MRRATAYSDLDRAARADSLFARMADHLGKRPDARGYIHIDCPECGRGDKHFGFRTTGGSCFRCGCHVGLWTLAQRLGVVGAAGDRPPVVTRHPIPAGPPPVRKLDAGIGTFVAEAAADAHVVAAWRAYKPIPPAVIAAACLGIGAYPGGLWYREAGDWRQCLHARLIVPIIDRGILTGLRARATACSCRKWLSPGGTQLALYNADAIGRADVVFVLENPIDALWLTDRGVPAVATFGASVWRDTYTARIARVRDVVVAFDNDEAGRRATTTLVARLRSDGIAAVAFDWPNGTEGADMGDLLARGTI